MLSEQYTGVVSKYWKW